MFGNCCGCSSKEDKNPKEKQSNNAITLSDNNVIVTNDSKAQMKKNITFNAKGVSPMKENAVCMQNELENNTSNSITGINKIYNGSIVEQPKNSVESIPKGPNYPLESILKRQSVVSEIKIEDYDNDDEVFSEGVGPPISAQNLGTPFHKIPLPKWFSQDDDEEDQEIGGVQEPPATPVGRDELALRRHRFFSELISVAQHATQHKVRFDPLGPVVAGVYDSNSQPCSELEALVIRLENVTLRLENISLPVQLISEPNSEAVSPNPIVEETKTTMSVTAFQYLLEGPFAQYLSASQQIGGDVADHSKIVNQAFQAQLQYLKLASQSKAPTQSDQITFLQPTSQHICAIQEYREKHRTSKFFNHLSAVSESIPALGWVTISPAPGPYVKEMNDAGQFYTNRVLKEWKEKDKHHVEWVKAWVQTLTELQAFVKQHHTTGLVWAGKNTSSAGSIPPPPPGCPPLPPPILAGDFPLSDDAGTDRSALFAQINQGEDITKSLKKVTADMQTHKNTTLRTGPAPFKAPQAASQVKSAAPSAPVDKPPVFTRDGKKWLIEYQKGNQNLVVENAEMNNVVYLFKCVGSTVTVKGKINSIIVDSCKKTSVVFDRLVSCIEFINCQSVQMQVLGKVPTISIDKTDGCQMYLCPDALDVEVVSSKSSEMNVLVPTGNGDYIEYAVPEQYKTTVLPGRGLSTIVVESTG